MGGLSQIVKVALFFANGLWWWGSIFTMASQM